MSVDSAHAANTISSIQHDIERTVLRRKRKLTELYTVSTSDQPIPQLNKSSHGTALLNFLDQNDLNKGRYFDASTLPSRRTNIIRNARHDTTVTVSPRQLPQTETTQADAFVASDRLSSPLGDTRVTSQDRRRSIDQQLTSDVSELQLSPTSHGPEATVPSQDVESITEGGQPSSSTRSKILGSHSIPSTRKSRPARLHSPPYSPDTSSDGQDVSHIGGDPALDASPNVLTPHHDSHDDANSERANSTIDEESKDTLKPYTEAVSRHSSAAGQPLEVASVCDKSMSSRPSISGPRTMSMAEAEVQSAAVSEVHGPRQSADSCVPPEPTKAASANGSSAQTAGHAVRMVQAKLSMLDVSETDKSASSSSHSTQIRSQDARKPLRDVVPGNIHSQGVIGFTSPRKRLNAISNTMAVERAPVTQSKMLLRTECGRHRNHDRIKKAGKIGNTKAVTIFPTRRYERWRHRCRLNEGYERTNTKAQYFHPLHAQEAAQQTNNRDLKILLDNRTKVLTTAEREIENSERLSRLILGRVKQLQESDRWSLRQRKPAPEPDAHPTFWDRLLRDAKSSRIDFREERKLKLATAKLLAGWCAQYAAANAVQRMLLRSRCIALSQHYPEPLEPGSSEDDEALRRERDVFISDDDEIEVFSDFYIGLKPTQVSGLLLETIPMRECSSRSGAQTSDDSKPVQSLNLFDTVRREQNKDEEIQGAIHEVPPEDTSCALFAPESRSLKKKMNIPNVFKAPNRNLGMLLPPQGFYETRLPSQWTYEEDLELKRLMKDYPANWMLISQLLTPKSNFTTAAERRTPWECYERLYILEGQPNVDIQQRSLVKPLLHRLDQAQKAFEEQQRQFQSQIQQARETGQPTSTFLQKPFPVPRRVERKQNRRFAAVAQAASRLARKRETAISKQEKSQQADAHAPKPQPPRQDISHDPKYYSERKRAVEIKQADQIQERRRQLMEMQRRQQAGYPAALTHGIGQQMQNGMTSSHTASNVLGAAPGLQHQNRSGQHPALRTGLPNNVTGNGQVPLAGRPVSTLPNQRLLPHVGGHGQDNMAHYLQQQAAQQRYQNTQQQSQTQQNHISPHTTNATTQPTTYAQSNNQFSLSDETSPVLRHAQTNGTASHSPPHAQYAMAAATGLPHHGLHGNQPQALSSGQVPQLFALVHQIQKQNPQLSEEQAREQATERLKSITRHNALQSASGLSGGSGQGQQQHQSNGVSQTPYHHAAPTPQMQSPYQQNGLMVSGRQHINHHTGLSTQHQQYQQSIRQQMYAQQIHNLPQSANSGGAHASPSPHMAHLPLAFTGANTRTPTPGGYMRPPSRSAIGYEVAGYAHHDMQQRPGSATNAAAQSPRPISAQGFNG